jgi:hypothetical protein
MEHGWRREGEKEEKGEVKPLMVPFKIVSFMIDTVLIPDFLEKNDLILMVGLL